MPLFNIFKNSAHYWILSGALLAGAVYGPWIGAQAVKGTVQDDSTFMLACAGVWAVRVCDSQSPGQRFRSLTPNS